MNFKNIHLRNKSAAIIVSVAAFIMIAGVLPTHGHGGKSHGDSKFSSFMAVQEASKLYDRLITMEKLPEAWETGLTSIVVSIREAEEEQEYVVRFNRKEGDPRSVYFFFDMDGQYSGSNFTGD